jgi:hypothetical protein
MAPLVSVIINNYNYGRYVGTAIQSALQQTYERVEVIVVDDGSSDSSRDVISAFGETIKVILKDNGGQASAINAGVAIAGGDFIMLLDSDDYLFPETVGSCVENFPAGYSRIYFQVQAVDKDGNRLAGFDHKIPYVEFDGDALLAAATGARFPATVCSANFFNANHLKAVLPIPEVEWRICADNFVAIQTAALGPVRSIGRTLGVYRIHGGNGWMAQGCLYTDKKRLGIYLNYHFQGEDLIAENCRRLGIKNNVPALGDDFWLLQLLCAARQMNVSVASREVPGAPALLRASVRYLTTARRNPIKRAVNAFYLVIILLSPKYIAMRLLELRNALERSIAAA